VVTSKTPAPYRIPTPRRPRRSPTAGAAESTEPNDTLPVTDFESHARGVSGVVDGIEVVVGHPDLFDERGWAVPNGIREAVAAARDVGRVPVAVGRDGAAEGSSWSATSCAKDGRRP